MNSYGMEETYICVLLGWATAMFFGALCLAGIMVYQSWRDERKFKHHQQIKRKSLIRHFRKNQEMN